MPTDFLGSPFCPIPPSHQVRDLFYPVQLVQCIVVLTLTRIIMSVVTGQVPATLKWKNAPGKKKALNHLEKDRKKKKKKDEKIESEIGKEKRIEKKRKEDEQQGKEGKAGKKTTTTTNRSVGPEVRLIPSPW